MPKRKMGDVVVLLPGILGSVLARDGKDVWAVNAGAALDALLSLGGNIKALKLEDDPIDVDDLGDGVTAPRLMPDVHLVPGLWKIDGYTKVERALAASYELEKGKNYFPFPYDWRRDNRVHAARLARESKRWLAEWREHSGNKDAKLILIGHSMGGLISRYFLEVLDGWRDTRALITFGTPFRGSINAINFLHHGMKKKLGPITLINLTDLLRSFTSVHQLLPEYACADAGNGLVRLDEIPLIEGVNATRFKAFADFHAEIQAEVEAHQDDDEYRAGSYKVHPIVGIRQPTLQSVELRNGTVKALRTYEGVDTDGDGTVPKQSATPIEWIGKDNEMYASERHASLQNFDAVLVQVDGLLRDDKVRFRELPTTLSLDLDDLYGIEEPITLGVKAEAPGVEMQAIVFDRTNGAEMGRADATSTGEWQSLELAPLPPGTYGVELLGLGAPPADPVHDVFVVAGEAE